MDFYFIFYNIIFIFIFIFIIAQIYLPSGREVKVTVGPYYHNVVVTVPGSDMDKGDRQLFHPDPQLPQLVFVFVYRPSLCLYAVRVAIELVYVFVYCPSLCLYTVRLCILFVWR